MSKYTKVKVVEGKVLDMSPTPTIATNLTSTEFIDDYRITLSTWCVESDPKKQHAACYVYQGSSYCTKHFLESKSNSYQSATPEEGK